ncbi:MAG: FAD-dependent oxidoreductase, partial [Thermoanaerobaculia bacterium]|nr:FAD-dependent oxidoreductase [Thermoanaerobaculia bacterium]
MTSTFETVAPPVDVLVVGSGVAGLAAGLTLEGSAVRILTKGELGTSGSSPRAQGGIAAAVGEEDSPEIHATDTIGVGGGLSDDGAVSVLSREGPPRIDQLLELGTRFDRDEDGELLLGREAAHSRRRILHAGGDATGREMVRALSLAATEAPWIEIEEKVFVEDLLSRDEAVLGVVARHAGGRRLLHPARAVILAAGGVGQLYRWTTNPVECTGDGLAMASRAGAVLADLEFVQFHPTALACGRDPLPLL